MLKYVTLSAVIFSLLFMVFTMTVQASNAEDLSHVSLASGLAPELASGLAPGETYQIMKAGYVLSTAHSIEALCKASDEFIDGGCIGDNRLQFPDEREYGVFLEPGRQSEGAPGWSCGASYVHPQQVLKIIATATCRKGS